jgi:site-specific DNA recombinase
VKPTKAAGPILGYVRVSTDKQADKGVSLDAQTTKLRAYAALYELELGEIIIDAGASAKTLERPGLQRALGMLRAGEASGLLVAKLDRLTRSVRDLGALVEDVFGTPGGPALLSVGEQFDTRSAAGRMVMNVLASVSQWEREAIGERTRDALAELKAQGKRLGRPRFGSVVVEGLGLVEDAAQQEALVLVRELRATGASHRLIAEQLNARGVPATRAGAKWWPRTVREALRLPVPGPVDVAAE